MRRQHIFAALTVCILAAPAFANDAATVGQWSDPQRLAIHGAVTFPPEVIREELYSDFAALLASHPLAPKDSLAPTLERRLLAGYHKAGFADAQIHVALEEQAERIAVHIDEGPRYASAGVRIEGTQRIAIHELEKRLTERYPPKEAVRAEFFQHREQRDLRWRDKDGKEVKLETPIWTLGKPAPLDEASRKHLREKVAEALAELGYPFAQFDVNVIPSPSSQTAELLVQIGSEGPPAEVRDIEIIGAEKNSRAVLLAYLDLKPGELISQRRRIDLEHRLWESGCFLEQQVTLLPPRENLPAKLRIEVTEYRHAPPLDASLSREEAALLKSRLWLTGFLQGGEADLVIQGHDEQGGADIVFAPHQGLLVTLTQKGADGHPARKTTLLVSEDEVGIYDPSNRYRLSGRIRGVQLTAQLAFSVGKDPENPFSLNFSIGFRSLDQGEQAAPLEAAISVAPVFCLGLAHEQNARASWQGDILTITSDDRLVQIDARDGRVLRYASIDPANPGARGPEYFEKGAFARRRFALRTEVQDTPNQFDATRPVSSIAAGLLNEDLLAPIARLIASRKDSPSPSAEPDFSRVRMLRKLAERGVLQPLDDWALRIAAGEKKDKFQIPPQPADPSAQGFVGHVAIAWGLPAAEVLFPRDSWPWTLCREAALTIAGRPSYLGAELQRIHAARETGPLCSLSVAALLRLAKLNHADAFASRGLAALDREAFLRDCQPWLDQRTLCGKCVHRAAAVLQAMDEEDVQLLAKDLLKGDAPILEAAARELRRDRAAPLEESLPASLAAAWEVGLRRHIEEALESYLPDDTFRIGRQP